MDLLAAATPLPAVPPGLDLGEPFTPAMAAQHGVGRSMLERLVRDGLIIRLVRGVYVGTSATLSPGERARALGLVLSRRHLVVDRTAAWIHGAPAIRPAVDAPMPLDLARRRRYPVPRRPLDPSEIIDLGGVRCTSPVRTALDVARHLAPERALPLLDGILHSGAATHAEVMETAARQAGRPEDYQVRELIAIADARSTGAAESVLRLHWLSARLPTPIPGVVVADRRLAVGLTTHRFGVALAGANERWDSRAVDEAGWTVIVLDPRRVLLADAESLGGHLEREFDRHLLVQME